jgi:hypothetical protein
MFLTLHNRVLKCKLAYNNSEPKEANIAVINGFDIAIGPRQPTAGLAQMKVGQGHGWQCLLKGILKPINQKTCLKMSRSAGKG